LRGRGGGRRRGKGRTYHTSVATSDFCVVSSDARKVKMWEGQNVMNGEWSVHGGGQGEGNEPDGAIVYGVAGTCD
jgi:hypothetical protein